MKLYHELASWWHLLSSPEEYEEESRIYWDIISRYHKNIKTALELGSGGGNNAYHLKKHCRFTLTDLSPEMIRFSEQLNPDCIHHVGDMRTIRLDEAFDLVFIHDAIMMMQTESDLSSVFYTAKWHLKNDGLLFIAPDFFTETFEASTEHGGHDDNNRSIRYLEWTRDDDPDDNIVETEFSVITKEDRNQINHFHDSYKEGLFSKSTWKKLLEEQGFQVEFEEMEHSELDPGSYIGIVARL